MIGAAQCVHSKAVLQGSRQRLKPLGRPAVETNGRLQVGVPGTALAGRESLDPRSTQDLNIAGNSRVKRWAVFLFHVSSMPRRIARF